MHSEEAMAELESYKIGEIKNEDMQIIVKKIDPFKKYLRYLPTLLTFFQNQIGM